MDQKKVFYLKKAGGAVAATIVPHVQPKKSNINGAMECDELEAFAIKFKEERAKFGYTQFDVQESLLNVYGLNFSQTTISRFEVLNLSFKNMQNLARILGDWLTDLRNAHAEKCKILDSGTNDGKRRIRKVVVTIDDMKNYRARLEQSFPTSSDHYPTSKTKLVAPEWTRTSDVPAKSERTTCTLQGSLSSLSKTFSRKRLRVRDSCSSSSQGSSADPANLFKKPKEEPLDDESMEASVKTEVNSDTESPSSSMGMGPSQERQEVDRDSDSELDEEDRMDGYLHDTGRNRRGVISYQPKLRKKKLILTPEQKQVLEIMFLVTDHPSPARMEELAASLELQFEEVRNWFNNHRARKRLESLEEKLELSAVGSQLVEQIQKMVPPKEEPKVVECKVPVASDDVKKKKKETWRDIKDLESTFPLSNPYKVFHDHDYAYVKFRTTIDNQRRWYVRFGTTEDMQRANERTLD